MAQAVWETSARYSCLYGRALEQRTVKVAIMLLTRESVYVAAREVERLNLVLRRTLAG